MWKHFSELLNIAEQDGHGHKSLVIFNSPTTLGYVCPFTAPFCLAKYSNPIDSLSKCLVDIVGVKITK